MKKVRVFVVNFLAVAMLLTVIPQQSLVAQEVVISCPRVGTGKCHRPLWIGFIVCCYFTGGQNHYCYFRACGGPGTPEY